MHRIVRLIRRRFLTLNHENELRGHSSGYDPFALCYKGAEHVGNYQTSENLLFVII